MAAPPRAVALAGALAGALLAVCGGPQGGNDASHGDADPAAGQLVTVRAVLLGETGDLALGVEVAVRAGAEPLPEPLDLVVPERWAGYGGLGEVILEMTAEGGEGEPLRLHREPGLARVSHPGLDEVRVRYLVEPVARELTSATRFQAVVRPSYVFGYGRNLLVWPRHVEPSAPVAGLRLEPGPTGTRWATTLGAIAPSWQIDGVTFYDIAEEAYLAGAFPGEAPAGTAFDPDLPVAADNAPLLEALAGAGGADARGPIAIVLRRADDPEAATGTGRPGGVVLELGDDVDWRAFATQRLLEHELLHRAIGFAVRFAEGHEQATLWFKEGVVDYLAALAVPRSRVDDWEAGWLAAVGDAVTGYRAAQRSGAASRGEEDYWRSAATRRAPYDRGFLLALGLDALLAPHGASLGAVVEALVERCAGGPPLTEAALREALVEAAPEAARAELRGFLEAYAGASLPLPVDDWLEAAGLRAEPEESAVAYFGVEVEQERDGRWRIARVDPRGPARLSGLVAGEALLEPPLLPERGADARFVVQRGGARHVVTVEAGRGVRRVWVVSRRAAGELQGGGR
jgi:hypothetical protein